MKRLGLVVLAVLLAVGLAGCAGMEKESRQRQVASMLAYLFPGTAEPPHPAGRGRGHQRSVPDRGGLRAGQRDAGVPVVGGRSAASRRPGPRRVREVPVHPRHRSSAVALLEPGGGFANLDRIAALLRLDAIALVSYDQVQHADATALSLLYWTGIGAYIVPGDRYDVLTVVETAVFDIKSRRLLMRAAGTSNVKGSATLVGFSGQSREARLKSFEEAVTQMIGNLHGEVKTFRERAPSDPKVKLVLPPGYNPSAERPAQPPATPPSR